MRSSWPPFIHHLWHFMCMKWPVAMNIFEIARRPRRPHWQLHPFLIWSLTLNGIRTASTVNTPSPCGFQDSFADGERSEGPHQLGSKLRHDWNYCTSFWMVWWIFWMACESIIWCRCSMPRISLMLWFDEWMQLVELWLFLIIGPLWLTIALATITVPSVRVPHWVKDRWWKLLDTVDGWNPANHLGNINPAINEINYHITWYRISEPSTVWVYDLEPFTV